LRRAARRDENEPAIVKAAKAWAASRGVALTIQPISEPNVPDLLLGLLGLNILVEVKNPANYGKLKAGQAAWAALWQGQTAVVSTAADIEKVLERTTRGPQAPPQLNAPI